MQNKTIQNITKHIETDQNVEKAIKYNIQTALKTIENTDDIERLKSIVIALLEEAKDREFFVKQDVEYIALLNKKLMNAEFILFAKLKRTYDNLEDHDKIKFKNHIENERRKIYTNDFHELVLESEKLCMDYEDKLQQAKIQLQNSDVHAFRQILKDCLVIDEKINDVLRGIKTFEKKLFGLAERETYYLEE